MAKYTDELIGHTADGIQEYDNPMPLWWLGILYGTMIWSVGFLVWLGVSGWNQEDQYADEVAASEALYAPIRQAEQEKQVAAAAAAKLSGGPASSAEDVEAGRAIFATNCVACHAADATGGIGPNLTDSEWIHGGSLEEITGTVTNGVIEKGMLSWGPILGAEKVRQVASFVHSLGGGR